MANREIRRRRDLLQRTHELLSKGAIKKPKWYNIMISNPPIRIEAKTPYLKEIKFPHDNLIENFYAKNDEVKSKIVGNKVAGVMTVHEFVQRQLQVMKGEKLTEDEAYSKVMELAKAKAQSKDSSKDQDIDMESMKNIYNEWQAAEDRFWKAAKNRMK